MRPRIFLQTPDRGLLETAARSREHEQGAVAIMVALMLVVLLAFAAMVVDVGLMYHVRNELQNASDAAALAGAAQLDGKAEGLTRAGAAVERLAKQHKAFYTDVDPPELRVFFGHWTQATRTFQSLGEWDMSGASHSFQGADPSQVAASVNAVQVVSYRSNATSKPVLFSFGAFVGKTQGDIKALATAVGGGPIQECRFPLVVANCALTTPDPQNPVNCQYCMTFQSDKNDTAGWTSFGPGNDLRELVIAACGEPGAFLVGADGQCTGCSELSQASDVVPVNNGNACNPNNECGAIADVLLRDNPQAEAVTCPPGFTNCPNKGPCCVRGKAFKVRVPAIQAQEGPCDAGQYPKFASHREIVGFATLEIVAAKTANNEPLVVDVEALGATSCALPPSGNIILGHLRCDATSSQPAGGDALGTDAPHVRLVE
jgi:hypothetical protein